MAQLLNLSRAARLIGVPRGILQQAIRDGRLASFDGMVSTADLLAAFPDADLDSDPVFEKITKIKEESFGKRVRERLLPDREVLSARLFEQSGELADLRHHLERYHGIVVSMLEKLRSRGYGDLAQWLDGQLKEALVTGAPDPIEALEGYMRIFSAKVKLVPSGREFFSEGADTLLEAALRSGLAMNYGCSSGNCGLCKARVVSGETRQVRHHDYLLSEAEKNSGYILSCSHAAVGDVVLEALEASRPEDIPLQEIEARVKSVEPLGESLVKLHLQCPRSSRMRFFAGQSAILESGNLSGKYPISSCPCDDRNLEFHLPESDALARLEKGESVWIRGPYGKFVLDEDSGREPLFIVANEGFSRVKGIVEHAVALDIYSSILLYRIGGAYLSNLCRAWEDALDNFSYHESVGLPALEDLENRDIYLAGPAEFVTEAREKLVSSGVSPERIFYP
ncbi:MAG: 2Fe-2S iron-sulfur cluster binding domain-containing protein [Burkholderiales bacterium]|nr:2Fe-2S iron-sulfur cluster binding domain-containing protein [Burkholderiales bacterium]